MITACFSNLSRQSLFLFIVLFLLSSCAPPPGTDNVSEDILASKAKIDSSIARKTYYSEVLIKRVGIDGLAIFDRENIPSDLEITYSIWRNSKDEIRLIATTPIRHPSGLNMVFEHYFNEAQQTFAFTKTIEFYNSACSYEPLLDIETFFFDEDFDKNGYLKMIKDPQGQLLDTAKCKMINPPKIEYSVAPDLKTYLNQINTGKK